jgi:hypothetical protein
MSYRIQHAASGDLTSWHYFGYAKDLESAVHRARQYALDNGGYVCVTDATGTVVFGTDPAELARYDRR